MNLNLQGLQDKAAWEGAGIALPACDIGLVAQKTKQAPAWLHFGAGNIFRGYIASLQQRLLDAGLAATGIVAAESFDTEIIDNIYAPHDNLVLNVILNPDATTAVSVAASIAEALKAGPDDPRLAEIAACPSLQMISYTITEKGYATTDSAGNLLPAVADAMQAGPGRPGPAQPPHAMCITAQLLHRRFLAGGHPIALVSLDNCSKNGDRLKASVTQIAAAWAENSLAPKAFLDWLCDEAQVSFPWSMIDKITPSPAKAIADMLAAKGIAGIDPIKTSKQTYIAAFVNAERPQYLVIEDKFPNGRPPLEKAGVYFTDRATVNKAERMKVTACLNPLHSAMAPYACLLGYAKISEAMKDPDIAALVKRTGYAEGLPVVESPGIFSPEAFIDEVVNERLPNPFIPDAPQRIMVDHSQKVGIRFGETIKSHIAQSLDLSALTAIPLAIAGWLRYLLAVDDSGSPMPLSADPLADELRAMLSGVKWDDPASHTGQIAPILKNSHIFGLDLTETLLAPKIKAFFAEQLEGPGAVRRTLHKRIM
jgi:fructuronate reductase